MMESCEEKPQSNRKKLVLSVFLGITSICAGAYIYSTNKNEPTITAFSEPSNQMLKADINGLDTTNLAVVWTGTEWVWQTSVLGIMNKRTTDISVNIVRDGVETGVDALPIIIPTYTKTYPSAYVGEEYVIRDVSSG